MCTITAIFGRHPRYPLVVAANRDEVYARPASAPSVVAESPRVVAGLDGIAGGTWMGANECGLFVGLTNQRSYEGADGSRLSRGEVVLEALEQEDPESVDALLESLDARDYNGFNLLYGDARRLRVAYARPERRRVEVEALSPGVWVLANDRIGSPDFPKADRARGLLEPLVEAEDEALVPALRALLADHHRPDPSLLPREGAAHGYDPELLGLLQALCVHTPFYGTRSATVLLLSEGAVERYLYADGPPCQRPFDDLTALFSRA